MSDPSRPVSGVRAPSAIWPGRSTYLAVASCPQPHPKPRHHFTTLRQVDQLVEASEAEPDLGFMARLLALCSLPRHEPRRPKRVRPTQRAVLPGDVGGRTQ